MDDLLASAPPPNVLLLIADDFKPLLKQFGSPQGHKMTNLNRLAEQSITFRNAHCQIAVCGPSRASFLTSLRPDTTGIYSMDPNVLHAYRELVRSRNESHVLILPELFRLAGYATYGVGKHLQQNEVHLLSDATIWSSPTYNAHGHGPRPQSFSSPYLPPWIHHPAEAKDDTFFPDGQAANLTAHLIATELGHAPAKDTSSQPWFLALGLWKPHLPWHAPQKYFDLAGSPEDYVPYHNLSISGLTEDQQRVAYGPGCTEIRAYLSSSNKPAFVLGVDSATDDNLARAQHAYHATALYMDAQMGLVLRALDKSPSRDNTIVVFLGDHGFHLGDHGLYCKHTNFEQATKVPLIIRPPLRDTHWQRGAQSFAPVELLDLMPTLYDLAGIKLDRSKYAAWEGVSLVPIMHKPATAWVKLGAVSQYFRGHGRSRQWGYSLRTTRYRATRWRTFTEYYDYFKDPWETAVDWTYDNQTKRMLRQTLYSSVLRTGNLTQAMLRKPFDFADRRLLEQQQQQQQAFS